ncbi:MAG: gamma-glutamyl-gamma-aminobutyrate hydrolase family protein, partial [Pseudomonadota bacterium]|nr:gamma-glutamyl-gamma-aminobutyrate hydrolase family protein [Pseudomonadota bacterium]
MDQDMDRLLIVDFGSQVTQLIARRVRESGVYCEIVPYHSASEKFAEIDPRAVILSGGPSSVADTDTPRIPENILHSGTPILGICYGQQALCAQLGGSVEQSDEREF